MCDTYYNSLPPAARNASHVYGDYYLVLSYDHYAEPEIENTVTIYRNLVGSRKDHMDGWKFKVVDDWNEDDTVSWVIEIVQSLGICEFDVPFHNFRVSGRDLRSMKPEEVLSRMSYVKMDPSLSRRLGQCIFDKLHNSKNKDMLKQTIIFKYAESDPYQHESAQTLFDLDKNRLYASDYKPNNSSLLQAPCDSSDDAEDPSRTSNTASPDYLYGSEGSKSCDEDDKRKLFKRPPGRPKGSGRKINKRPRSVSVPEFLRDLLMNPKYCPDYIRWEDHALGKFRFVKPDEVAKLWGKLKQNDNMTFEKFSRAMRYHYRQSVLVSVPTARLVYQFGPKGPDYKTDNHHVIKIKSELDDMYP